MQHLEVSGAVRHIYIYICIYVCVCVCVIRRLKVSLVRILTSFSCSDFRKDERSKPISKDIHSLAYPCTFLAHRIRVLLPSSSKLRRDYFCRSGEV